MTAPASKKFTAHIIVHFSNKKYFSLMKNALAYSNAGVVAVNFF
jgi:hypothetical protein